jgi:DNA topoisomerase-3
MGRLFIAEKPSLGRAIAGYLPVAGTPVGRPATHIVCGSDIVTWCFGHLLEMVEPDGYGEQYKTWRFDHLPIIPEQWKLEPKGDARHQLKVIKGLLKDCDEVVHAGDPDREGQLLVDEVLEHLGNRKPVRRIWLAALDEASVRKALADLRDNGDYAKLKASAEARQRGDWLVGMNLTRAYTLAGREQGYDGVLSIGRVQTPTLALIVNRCMTIENFRPVDFFTVEALVSMVAGFFKALWRPGDDITVDEAGRVLDRGIADRIRAKVEGRPVVVTKFEAKEQKQAAPLPFSLSALQAAANRRFGLGAQKVLDTAQSLYEAKLTSYPRTDCSYLPESQWAEVERVLSGLPAEYTELVEAADPKLKSGAWNDKKVTAHHAIVPTGQNPENLSGAERQVYDLIVRAYLAQFFPPYIYRQTNITLDIEGEVFTASGRTPISPGWKVVFGEVEDEDKDEKGEEERQTLPTLQNGDQGTCEKAEVVAKKTKPPAYFTEGTLIQAMTNIHQLVDDPELKKRLRETAGIGTEATRAGIIETLKNRSFIIEKGKQLRDTPAGRKLILALPEQVKSPGLTGLFEQLLEAIAEGVISPNQFLDKQIQYVRKYVEHAMTMTMEVERHTCPECKKGFLRRIKGGKSGWFWGCSRYAEEDGCKATFEDKGGKPDIGGRIGGGKPAAPTSLRWARRATRR